VARFREHYQGDVDEARLAWADSDGAELIPERDHPRARLQIGTSLSWRAWSVMQAMMDIVGRELKSGVRMLSESVRASAGRATSAGR